MSKKPQTLLDADFDDSSDDDDYVPDQKALKKSEQELSKQNGTIASGSKTGIELLKEKKLEKEVDEFWDLMNQEDDIYSKRKAKAAKTEDGQDALSRSKLLEKTTEELIPLEDELPADDL